MRLINTTTLQLRWFFHDPPPYAILSHTWGEDEVTYQDMQLGLPHASAMAGFAKIEGCCRQAVRDGYQWAWVDTCCIDKLASAELAEAIECMFLWYKRSAVCYVYMPDVTSLPPSSASASPAAGLLPGGSSRLVRKPNPEFARSRWFTRGWTLQELIAPRIVVFYDKAWVEMGTKSSMIPELKRITGIRAEVLQGASPAICCVAERLSWAASRQTQKIEDRAYSLIGIFDVSLPMIYGEGHRAFMRLQLQIMNRYEDFSILAWSAPNGPPSHTSVLALDPSGFTPVLSTQNAPPIAQHGSPGAVRQGFTWHDVYSALGEAVTPSPQNRWAPKDGPMARLGTGMPIPAEVTPRGIRVNLPVQNPRALGIPGGDGDFVAWLFLGANLSGLGGVNDDKTGMHPVAARPEDSVWFCVMLRLIAPETYSAITTLSSDFIAGRPRGGRTNHGLICAPFSAYKDFQWKTMYLVYRTPPVESRIEWGASYSAATPIKPAPVLAPHLGYHGHSNPGYHNVLTLLLGPGGSISLESHHPSHLQLTEGSPGSYSVSIPALDHTGGPHASLNGQQPTSQAGPPFQEMQFLCSHRDANRSARASPEMFVVVFATFYEGNSRKFSCGGYRMGDAYGTGAMPRASSPGQGLVKRSADIPQAMDRANIPLDSGYVVQVAIKEHVYSVQHHCHYVSVTLKVTVAA